MTTKETCGEHFQVGQSLSGGWPPAICQRDKNHSGTHGLIPDTENKQVGQVEMKPSKPMSSYELGMRAAAKLICGWCEDKGDPIRAKDRITYPFPTWVHIGHHPVAKCLSTAIYEAIRSLHETPETSL